ncbi:MAG TPA: alpha/beta hydrolase [Hyphomicrobiaceae bacterium]|nr:alpha/beta hydrolase [Hyphomicrobiaceae bacterium]
MNILSALAAILVVVVALVIVGAAALQQFLIYHPDRHRIAPAEVGLSGVVEREIMTPDGNAVLAWWSPPRPGRPSVLYFHGNAGSLADRSGRIRRFQDAGIGLFMMTYRGYGGSTGKPSERDNVADGKRAFDALVGEGVEPGKIFIFGESLGTGVAVQVAAQKSAAGLILDAPFTSMLDLAHLHYPYLPAGLLLRERYETIKHIAKVNMPLLIVHGVNDAVIPLSLGQAVYNAAPGDKQFIAVEGAGHLDHDAMGSFEQIFAWIDRQVAGRRVADPDRVKDASDDGAKAAR